jgi:hypothetical protein
MMWRPTIRDRIDLNRNTLVELAQQVSSAAFVFDPHLGAPGGEMGAAVDGDPPFIRPSLRRRAGSELSSTTSNRMLTGSQQIEKIVETYHPPKILTMLQADHMRRNVAPPSASRQLDEHLSQIKSIQLLVKNCPANGQASHACRALVEYLVRTQSCFVPRRDSSMSVTPAGSQRSLRVGRIAEGTCA